MKIGLVLSGGGARGVAHIGLLKGLEELGLRPDIISGASSGALVGALYAAGHSPKQILELVKAHSSSYMIIMAFDGLFSAAGLKHILDTAIPKNNFEALSIPLFVTATDINAGLPVAFSEGPLHELLIASSAVPGLFTPVKFETHYLVDGGVSDNLPVNCIKGKCEKIIGSHVNKLVNGNFRQKGRLEVIERCFHLAIAKTVHSSALLCDHLVEPDLQRYTMFEMKYADSIFKAGYQEVMKEKGKLLALAG
jgi:NTE family protein